MRVAFFDRNSPALSTDAKGRLLERLTKRLAELAGYRDVNLRVKHSSLEYDLEGRHSLTKKKLVGESKAHDQNVSGADVSAFVGKLVSQTLSEEADGLFISTSGITAEGRDFLTSFKDGRITERARITTLVGSEIPEFLTREGLVSEESLRTKLRSSLGLELFDVWLIVGWDGEFVVCTAGPTLAGGPSHAIALSSDGSHLPLTEDLEARLKVQLPDIATLQMLQPNATRAEVDATRSTTPDLPAIDPGVGWFDYKFPTPAECFVGRATELRSLADLLMDISNRETAVRAVQVASRSGVGKSSLLLRLPHEAPHLPFMTVDSRSLRVPADVRRLISQAVVLANAAFGYSIRVPRSQDEARASLSALGATLRSQDRVFVIQLDQFESVLTLPPVFRVLLDLIEEVTGAALPIVWILARKNDVAVTFDQGAKVDLARLLELSRTIGLDDFTPDEARVLIERMGTELGEQVRPELREAIETFSGGFPWLQKRICAHILSLHERGVMQREMVQTGLRAEDLFQEDLAGLSEPDKALLRTLAAHLPSTAAELGQRLEHEISPERLTEKLNEFLGTKLLRLAGDVYDTYNDVFKTYLVTGRIPFQARYLPKVTPGAAMKTLLEIARFGPSDLSQFQELVGGNQVAVLNKLRELRLLGLIEPQPGVVELTAETQSAIETKSLGGLLRRSMRANSVVTRTLDLLATRGSLPLTEVVDELRRQLPHIDVAHETWIHYARTLSAWLHYAGLARFEADALHPMQHPPSEELHGREFALGTFVMGTFVPSVRPAALLRLLEMMRSGSISKSDVYRVFGGNRAPGLLKDAVALDIAREGEGTVEPGPQARILFSRTDPLRVRDIAQLALAKPNVKAVLDAATSAPLDDAAMRDALSRYGSAQWTAQTWRWRMGILRSWLVATGQAVAGKAGLRAVRPESPAVNERLWSRDGLAPDAKGI